MHRMTRRTLATGSLGGMAALGLAGTAAAAAAAPMAAPGPNITPAVEAAWQAYLAKLGRVRQGLYATRFCDRPEVRLAANELIMTLQAVMYNWIMGIRTEYPRFDLHGRFAPDVYAYGLMNPDFAYRSASVDGTREYRLWGKKGTSRFFDMQVDAALDGKPDAAARSHPRNYRLDSFQMGPDGSFEIIASAKPQPGNWIQLPEGVRNVALDVREAFYDWDETPVEIHIEVSDGRPTGNFLLSEEDYITRLEAMGDLLGFVAEKWGTNITDLALRATNGAFNVFGWQHLPGTPGTNPNANYADCVYNLADDEALILEFDQPTGLYWGVQLGDVLMRSTDFVYHQSSLNGHQAQVSADGKVRMVVSARDPQVANWLDVVGVPIGFVQFRQYFTDTVVGLPKTKVVKVADVRRNMPADTRAVTVAERQEVLTRRRRGKLRQYGY